ncbi:queuosine biosynthesis protein QueC [Thermosulfidibacter takaii ABI70S6]|uniref:7-cyano-7-deazaguanine synthase n=1 Tax=Thermosulfidibacter takaii (strain DSM 17441 / JCM 13301 / NBRC 103674 / ABI70S6) TaxID=1298851 RepID=A0A0S3QUH6_THET7|nr:7-cyano-7-deazaguanine synthase QueC [Thermosulfidibacter takaii]BAT71969.1 queuosine biosynthesis protein QueC [Thermosulfidibacter takaii ABI70S6]
MKKALVIFSGGLDSTTCLYWAKAHFDEVYTVTFNYGQTHRIEVAFAQKIAEKVGVKEHKTFHLDLTQIGGSALTDPSIEIPDRDEDEILANNIPVTYVPFRNGIFLSIAAAFAETKGIQHIVGGWNAVDFSGYPDCRPEFVKAMEQAINTGTKMAAEGKPFSIHSPLINLTKSQIIALGLSYGADYSYSLSCYRGQEVPCFRCDSCKLRMKGWKGVGIIDHLVERLIREGKLKDLPEAYKNR